MCRTSWARLSAGFVGLSLGMFALLPEALATDGRTAVGMCIDSTASGARCSWSVNDKGEIDICNKNGCVYCASATAQCVVASRSRPRPRYSIPAGAELSTSIGSFRISPRPIRGPILKSQPAAIN